MIHRCMATEIQLAVDGFTGGNYKSMLQHLRPTRNGILAGLQHDFRAGSRSQQILSNGSQYQWPSIHRWGRNKKDAEQRAAGNALPSYVEKRHPMPPHSDCTVPGNDPTSTRCVSEEAMCGLHPRLRTGLRYIGRNPGFRSRGYYPLFPFPQACAGCGCSFRR